MIKLINKNTAVSSQGQMSQKSGEEAGVVNSMYCIKHYFKGSSYYSDVTEACILYNLLIYQ